MKLAALCLLLLLTACGGGSGNGSPAAQPDLVTKVTVLYDFEIPGYTLQDAVITTNSGQYVVYYLTYPVKVGDTITTETWSDGLNAPVLLLKCNGEMIDIIGAKEI